MDMVAVTGESIPVGRGTATRWVLGGSALGAACVALWLALRRRASRPVSAAEAPWAPGRLTPLGVVTSLRRVERERGASLGDAEVRGLRDEIRMLELKWFGPNAAEASEPELREVVSRWTQAIR
jgi:hypothetical protein